MKVREVWYPAADVLTAEEWNRFKKIEKWCVVLCQVSTVVAVIATIPITADRDDLGYSGVLILWSPAALVFLLGFFVLYRVELSYLVSIDYPARKATWTAKQEKARQRREAPRYSRDDDDDDSPNYWATGTYDPDRYYSAAREYGWDHMDYIRDNYGDLDTYEANRPD